MISTIQTVQERHLLLLKYNDVKVVPLESRLMILGRHPSQDISVPCEQLSREHATLLRVPSSKAGTFDFRLIDGGPRVNRSTNGIQINGKRAYLHLLTHGDLIRFSAQVSGLYLKVELEDAKYQSYLGLVATARELNQKTRDKIMLMTRVFDKLLPHLSPEKSISIKV